MLYGFPYSIVGGKSDTDMGYAYIELDRDQAERLGKSASGDFDLLDEDGSISDIYDRVMDEIAAQETMEADNIDDIVSMFGMDTEGKTDDEIFDIQLSSMTKYLQSQRLKVYYPEPDDGEVEDEL